LSVRARIVTAVTLLTALALSGAGALVYAVESQRLEDQAVSEIDQELDEFTRFTARSSGDVPTMLRDFLRQNVPDENEILVTWYDGRPRNAFPSGDPFVNSPAFRELVEPWIGSNGTDRVEVPEYGEAFLTVQQVSTGPEDTGALVIVTYLDRARGELRETMQTYAIVSVLALLMITAFGAWQSGRLLGPLRVLRDTAEEISATDLARRLPEKGNDDISALTRTVNGMLGRLESAFVGQRQFLDDAGHELKTPLTVLRGHLELLDASDPGEVAETRALLLDEVDRMSRLVGDLILLAKAGRPDFIAPQPVSLERFTHTVLAKCRGLGDRDWRLDGAGEGIVAMDEQRLTQAVLQVADNAVKHTRDGDLVEVGSSYDGQGARIWVRDTGPGVPEDDRDHVFERFGRSVVQPGDEGFGLGLSIVRAIATAHGGTVGYEDAAPGARFVITIPREAPWPAS
jgi:signal transduction histidine kinase